MNSFKNVINYFKTFSMNLEDVEKYYRDLRKYEYSNNIPFKGIELRKKLNPIVRKCINLEAKLSKIDITCIDDHHVKTDKPKIYVATHVGRYDIESGLGSIDSSAWLLMGDPGETYRQMDYLFLKANGILMVDTKDKEDRHIAKENCIKILNSGGNVFVFPEGAWNITENKIVLPLFNGVIEMAIRCDAEIIPIGIEKYMDKNGKEHYFSNVGKNISYEGKTLNNMLTLKTELRDAMAQLRYQIWEKECCPIEREQMSSNAKEEYLNSIMKDTENGYTVDVINDTKYHDYKHPEREIIVDEALDVKPQEANKFLYQNLTYTERQIAAEELCKKYNKEPSDEMCKVKAKKLK